MKTDAPSRIRRFIEECRNWSYKKLDWVQRVVTKWLPKPKVKNRIFSEISIRASQVKSSKPLFEDLVGQRNLDIAHSEKELAKLILHNL